MTSRTTLYRASKNPSSVSAGNLYALAEKERTSMEAIMGKPLYFLQRKIDDVIEIDGTYYAYKHDVPQIPPKFALFVFQLLDHSIIVARRSKVKIYNKIIGIVTLEIKKTPEGK